MDWTGRKLVVAAGLSRIYQLGGSEVTGIVDVDLDVAGGDFVLLKGNSGSGKSTLLSLIAGLEKPTRGRLVVADRDLQQATSMELTFYRRQVVGMIFQSFNLLPTLTVLENVCLPALLAGDPQGKTEKKAGDLIHWLNLGSRLDHHPAQLSGGEMQRTAIARALINDPAIVLADEPTGNLDSQNGKTVIDLLRALNRDSGRTIIMATHSNLADFCATRTAFLRDGRIVETI